MKSLMQLAALGGGLLLMATTPLQASIQVFTAAGVSCQQLFAGERNWTPSGSIHIGWSHPSIHGKVTLADVVEDDPAHQHWSFSMDTHLSIDYFGEHHFDSVMQGATCMTDASGSAQITIPSTDSENLRAEVRSAHEIHISGTVSTVILGKTDTFHLDDNTKLAR